jgi:hypothetical protein
VNKGAAVFVQFPCERPRSITLLRTQRLEKPLQSSCAKTAVFYLSTLARTESSALRVEGISVMPMLVDSYDDAGLRENRRIKEGDPASAQRDGASTPSRRSPEYLVP